MIKRGGGRLMQFHHANVKMMVTWPTIVC